MTENVSGDGTAVVKSENRFDDDTLRNVTSLADAVAVLRESGVVAEDYASAYGSGFTVLATNDKSQLINVELMILEWHFTDGNNGKFVSALVVTEKDTKYVVNDGGTGIRDQLQKVTDARLANGASMDQATKGLYVKRGLRRSDFTYDDVDQKTGEVTQKAATTFYLAN